jgi:ABC-2 type transport system permease protein
VIVGHLFFMALCYIGFKTSKMNFLERAVSHQANFQLDDFMSYIDGLFFARMALIPTFIVIMPMFISTLAGDMVAGEIQQGTLKLYASRQRSRTNIILSKLTAVYLVNLACCIYFAITGLIIGICFFGLPHTQLVFLHGFKLGTEIIMMPLGEAFTAYILTTLYFSISMMALGSIALFLSTVFNRMTSATIGAIVIYFVCYIVEKLPFTVEIRPYLLSKVMNGSIVFWLTDIPIGRLTSNLAALAIYIVIFSGLAVLNFNFKDIK